MSEFPQYLTLPQVAEKLQVSVSTVRRLVNTGELVATKIGARGQVRVDPDDLRRFVAKNQTTPAPPTS